MPRHDFKRSGKDRRSRNPSPKKTESREGEKECNSKDTSMGAQASVAKCAEKVKAAGGKYFIFGTGSKKGKCYLEKTSDEKCSEGWETDQYDFYKVDQDD